VATGDGYFNERVAALSQRGVPMHGIELSNAMVARLREKPGGEVIGVTIGDTFWQSSRG
jgi:hypothetical protein